MTLPKVKRIYQVAGLSLVGFCAVSIGVDKANFGPVASQLAGFCGAFAGALIAQRRRKRPSAPASEPDAVSGQQDPAGKETA